MDERQLVKKLNKRSRGALEHAIDHFTPYVNTVVWRVLGMSRSHEDLEEVVSDVFITLWTHAGEIDPEYGLRPWLGTVAHNKAVDLLKRKPQPLPLEEHIPSPTLGPEQMVETLCDAERLWRAVEALGEPDCTIFLRHYYYEEKLLSIAKDLELSLGTVKVRLSRGRKKLKEILKEGGELR